MAFKTQRKKTFYSDIFTEEIVAYYKEHWVEFVEDYIFNGGDFFLDEQHKQLIDAVQRNKRVAAKSGKGIGKTFSVSALILTFLSLYPNPKVICTAPSFGTLKVGLWPEVAKWLKISLMKDIFEHTSESLYLIESPKNWACHVRTAREKENIQGLHEDNMLVVIDEASGLRQDIFEALDTTLTSENNKIVMIGNPTQTSGPFFEAFTKYKSRWSNLTFNAELSSRVQKEQIDYYADKYGKTHDLYLVNVKGEFPSGSPDAFIKLSDVNAATYRYDDVQPVGEVEIGLDVARFGDDSTVLYWRYGYKVYPAKKLSKNSIPEAVQLVLDTVIEIRKTTGYDKKIRVKVDDTGVGSGVTDYLKLDREHNIEVIPINNGGAGNEKYQNEATVNWATLRDNIQYIALPDYEYVDGIAKPSNSLQEELSARRWRMSPSNKIMIEPKNEYKKEFKSSPDRADALVLCFAKKETPNVVLKNLDVMDKNTIKTLHYAGDEKFCSIFYSKDLKVSVSYTSWDGNRLYIYDEYVCDDSIISVATNVLQHSDLSRVIGNDRIFGDRNNGIDCKYRKLGVPINECYDYDEIVAVDSLMNLTTQKRLIISPNCSKTIDQLSSWKINNKRIEQERDFGLCHSLSYVTFHLKRKLKSNNLPILNKSYVKKEETDIKTNNYSEKMWMLM